MADILVRNLNDAVVERIDQKAAIAGLSRAEFLRRTIEQEANRDSAVVDVAHLDRFAALTIDLGDPDVMDRAWS